jgi:glycosyltransferase involved in cell wall biosynthesis
LGEARNYAIEKAQGEFIALLDCDDMWESEKLSLQIALFKAKPNIGVIFSDAYFTDENGQVKGSLFKGSKPYRGKVTNQLITKNFIPCLSVVIRKNLINECHKFDKELDLVEEYDLFLKLSLITEFDYLDLRLAKYKYHADNSSKNVVNTYKEEIICISNFKKLTTDKITIDCIEKRMAVNHLALLLYYIFIESQKTEKQEIMELLAKIKNKFLKLLLFVFAFLPKFINSSIYKMLNKIKIKQKVRKILISWNYTASLEK